MKKKKAEKKAKRAKEKEAAQAELARVRADKIEALATIQALEKKLKETETEAEELIGIAAAVGEKLEAARPDVESLRKALAPLAPLGQEACSASPDVVQALHAAFALATTLTGPIVPKGSGVPCEAAASFQRPSGEASMSLCWADRGHEGAHGDEEGRSW